MKFARPPVNEVGLSVSFAEPFAFDAYDVRATHDLFRADYPMVERAAVYEGSDLDAGAGLPPLSIHPISRWWLVSANNADVLQLQENYVARNWRRTVGLGEAPAYPGFEKLLTDLESGLAILKQRRERDGAKLPDLRSCELAYDDIIPALQQDGKVLISETLAMFKPVPARPMANWQSAWLEPIPIPGSEAPATLQVQIVVAAAARGADEPAVPIVRILWKAGLVGLAWDQLRPFFETAHDHISMRFAEVVERKVQESWGME